MLKVAAHLKTELPWSVVNAMWVLVMDDAVELIRPLQRYRLERAAGLIGQPTLILHGESDHFIFREQVEWLSCGLKAPKSLRVFTAEEGAKEHRQFGGLALLHHVLFKWPHQPLSTTAARRRTRRLDRVLRSALVCEPPRELQDQLTRLAATCGRDDD